MKFLYPVHQYVFYLNPQYIIYQLDLFLYEVKLPDPSLIHGLQFQTDQVQKHVLSLAEYYQQSQAETYHLKKRKNSC